MLSVSEHWDKTGWEVEKVFPSERIWAGLAWEGSVVERRGTDFPG